jgi:hypothetical protein
MPAELEGDATAQCESRLNDQQNEQNGELTIVFG